MTFVFLLAPIAAGAQPATPPDDDSFRHRLTISALWGWDNQFSGKMIKEARGTTTGGAPINLNETSVDDVYGRMGLFKIGAGYRTSPRAEVAVNLVISRSGADNPVNIGTATAASIPLFVNFDDYNYWGFEGGQRFFFARVRFTPYVGYLVGINRFDDIRGTFVNVPASATPGLAAQDGKFFEKSWALSFGPTGGVLVGFGPFEVMAEHSSVTWADCPTSTGWSRKASATSTTKARGGRYQSCWAPGSGSEGDKS
jgi:hypothetical protein